MSGCRKRKWMKEDSKKTENNLFWWHETTWDVLHHNVPDQAIALGYMAGRGEVDLFMLVAYRVKVDGQCFPEDHNVVFGLKTGGCYTEHRWNLFRFVKFDELIVEFDDLSPKHSKVWNTGTQIGSNHEVHTKSQIHWRHLNSSCLMASHLEFPGRIRVLLPVGSLLQPPSPSDTVVMLTEASQSDGACRGRSDDVRKQEERDRKVIVQVKVNSVLEKMFINTYNVDIL